jgi:hypothetical protein
LGALDVLREAEGLATEMRDEVRLGWVSGYMTNLFWEMGEQDRALNSGLRALEIATAHSHEGIRDLAQRYLGRSYHAMGDYRQATEVFTLSPRHWPAGLTRRVVTLSIERYGIFDPISALRAKRGKRNRF